MLKFFRTLTPSGHLLFAGVVLIAVLMVWLGFRAVVRSAEETGKLEERSATQQQTINNVEKANEAREENGRRDATARNADCLRRSRTPENCQ